MSNKILQQTQRLGRNNLPPAVQFALACRIRKEKGEPQVKGSYSFEKSDYSQQLEKTRGPINKYTTPEGVKCTLEECCAHLGLSQSRTSVLFSQYHSDYEFIYSNYGKARTQMDFKTRNGKKTSAAILAKYFGVTPSTVARAYKKAGNDYRKANADLMERFKDKVLGF